MRISLTGSCSSLGILPVRSFKSSGFVLRFSGSISESDSVKEEKWKLINFVEFFLRNSKEFFMSGFCSNFEVFLKLIFKSEISGRKIRQFFGFFPGLSRKELPF